MGDFQLVLGSHFYSLSHSTETAFENLKVALHYYLAPLKLNFLICNRDNNGTDLTGLLGGSYEKRTGKSLAPGP